MRRGNLVQRTVGACAGAAAVTLAVSLVVGQPLAGIALAAGLLIGSVNGWLAGKSLGLDASFRATSLGRLLALTVAGLGVGWLLGLENVPLTIIGLAAAQLLLSVLAAKAALETAQR